MARRVASGFEQLEVAVTLPVGRPRSGDRQRPGGTPREEILDAAAELFTSRGYAATSTRMIAEAVGIRQASLYYHVANKEELLEELLAETVQPSLAFALSLDAGAGPADARLFALAAYDTGVLCGGRWNLGALYLLPEVRGEAFARFRAERAELRAGYAQLIGELTSDLDEGLTDLVFGLVESVIQIRSEREISDVAQVAERVASGCLRLVGVPGSRIFDIQASWSPPVTMP
jgi:AcrR family transcriptional regulator